MKKNTLHNCISPLVNLQKRFEEVKKGLLLFFVFIINIANINFNSAFAQTASATWSLATNTSVVTSGNVTSSAQTSTGVSSVSYSSSSQVCTLPNITNPNTSTPTTGTSSTNYLQYTIAPASTYNLTVTTISMYLSANSSSSNDYYAVYYSTSSTFTTSTALSSFSTQAAVVKTTLTQVTFSSLSISVPDGQTLYVRVFPWNNGSASKQLASQSVVISGTTSPVGCTPPTLTYNVTMSPATTPVCNGSSITLGLDNSQTGVTYQLYDGGSALSGVTQTGTTGSPITFAAQTPSAGSHTYTVYSTTAGGTYCAQPINGGTTTSKAVTVDAAFSGGTLSNSTQSVCSNTQPADITYSASPSGGTTPQYQWYYLAGSQSSPSGNFSIGSWTAIGSTSTSTPTLAGATIGNVTSPTTYALRVTDVGSTACYDKWAGNSQVITIASPLSASNVTPTGSQSFVTGGTGSLLTAAATGGGTVTYAWGYRTVSGGTITAISGATSSTYTPTGANLSGLPGTYYLVCTITPSCGSAIISNEVTVTLTNYTYYMIPGQTNPAALGSWNTSRAGTASTGGGNGTGGPSNFTSGDIFIIQGNGGASTYGSGTANVSSYTGTSQVITATAGITGTGSTLEIEGNASLNIATYSFTFANIIVDGNASNYGTLSTGTSGVITSSGTVTCNGYMNMANTSGNHSFNNLTVNNPYGSGLATSFNAPSKSITISGNLSVGAGAVMTVPYLGISGNTTLNGSLTSSSTSTPTLTNSAITINNGGSLTINSSSSYTINTLTINSGGSMTTSTGALTVTNATSVAGTFSLGATSTSTLSGGLTVSGTMTTSTAALNVSGITTVTGSLTLSATSSFTMSTLIVNSPGNLYITGTKVTSTTFTVANGAQATFSGAGYASITNTICNGTINANSTNTVALGTLSGTGIVNNGTTGTASKPFTATSGSSPDFLSASGGTVNYKNLSTGPTLLASYNNLTIDDYNLGNSYATASGGTVVYGTFTLPDFTSTANLVKLTGGSSSPFTVNGTITIGNATLSIGSSSFAVTAKGDVVNNGTITQTSSSYNFIIGGTSAQSLKGTGTYNNTLLSNSGNISLGSNVICNGKLSLNSQILNVGSYQLTLGSSGVVYSGNATGTSFSSGIMLKCDGTTGEVVQPTSSTAVLVPVGIGSNYLPATVSTAAGSNVTIQPISGNHSPATSLTQIGEYWRVTSSAATNVTASFGFPDAVTPLANYDGAYYTSSAWTVTSVNPTGSSPYSLAFSAQAFTAAQVVDYTVQLGCIAPTTQTVSGTATLCNGSNTNITMAGQNNVTYQLYAGGTASGSTQLGSGSTLTWSVSPSANTTYTVQSTTATGSYCAATMNGSAVVTVNPLPTITLGTNPSVSQGAATANLPYSATTNGADQYIINYDAAANTAGFSDVSSYTSLSTSPIVLTLPTSPAPSPGAYNGTLTVKNSTTGCIASPANSFIVSITGAAPPSDLAAAAGQSVDNNFLITFTDDGTWGGAITSVNVDGTTYLKSNGGISVSGSGGPATLSLNPTYILKLKTAGSHTIFVSATNYSITANLVQTNVAGAGASISITTQPTAPASSGAVLAVQPVVTVYDQYGNLVGAGVSINATVTTGQTSSWTIGGTTTASTNSSGIATFTNLTATNITTGVYAATITFSGAGIITSGSFNIPKPVVTYTWIGGNGDYQVPSNWSPSRTSGVINVTDILQFNSGTVTISNVNTETVGNLTFTSGANVTLQKSTATATLTVSGACTITAGATLKVGTGVVLSSGGNLNINGILNVLASGLSSAAIATNGGLNNGTLIITAGTFTVSNTVAGAFTVNGYYKHSSATPIASTTATNTVFNDYSVVELNSTGITAAPTATYTSNSNLLITAVAPTSSLLAINTHYGNFNFNYTGAGTGIILTNASSGTLFIDGNFTLTNSNGTSGKCKIIYGNTSDNITWRIGGDLTIPASSAGQLQLSNATASGYVLNIQLFGNLNVAGTGAGWITNQNTDATVLTIDFEGTGKTINTGSSPYSFSGFTGITVDGSYTLAANLSPSASATNVTINGTLNCEGYTLTGKTSTALFTLASGATLETQSTTGLTGAIAGFATANKTFNAAANYIFDGTAAQTTGIALTAANNITINNTLSSGDAVTLSAATTFTGTLILTTGTFATGAYSLTISGNLTRTSGSIDASAASGTLVFAKSMTLSSGFIAANINNLTINSGITLNTVAALNVNSAFVNNGSITGVSTVNLVGSAAQTISGTGTLINLTLNNSHGATISSGNQSITGTLTVTNGTLNTGTNGLTLKSTSIANTAVVASVGGLITGTATVERYIPAGYRGYRDLASQVYNSSSTTGSIFTNWQEGGSLTNNGYGIFITGPTSTDATLTDYATGQIPANSLTGLDYSINGISSAYTYGYGTWPAIANTTNTNLDVFTGYRVLVRGDRSFNLATTPILNYPAGLRMYNPTTIRATGNLVYGTVTYSTTGVTGTANGSAITSTNALNANATVISNGKITQGLSMVANPYACPVSWTSVYNNSVSAGSNINGTWYFLDPTYGATGTYEGYNYAAGSQFSDETNASDLIQAGQAFFVLNATTSPTPKVVFEESAKQATSTKLSIFGAAAPLSKIYVELYNGTTRTDGAAVAFRNDFTNDKVGSQDAYKLGAGNDNISVSDKGVELGIDGRLPATASDAIALKIGSPTATSYQLKVDASRYIDNGVTPLLYDAYKNTTTALGSAVTTVNFTVDASTAASYANRFTIIFTPSALAVNSIVASATLSNKVATITWNTVGEKGESYYSVEKSTDGKNFTAIGQQAAKNTSTASYTATDNDAVATTNYYRIKAVSETGSIAYSNVVKVQLTVNSNQFSVYPNPLVGKTLNVSLGNVAAGKYVVSIYNVLGEKVNEQTISHSGGSATHAITINNTLAGGVYSLVIREASSNQIVHQSNLSVQP